MATNHPCQPIYYGRGPYARTFLRCGNDRLDGSTGRPPSGDACSRSIGHRVATGMLGPIRIPKSRPSSAAPELADYVAGWKQRSRKVITLALRQLLRLVREYPREPLLGAVREAGRYGLYDLGRLERMILRRVTGEYFRLDRESDDD
jgi:hypothetical protein